MRIVTVEADCDVGIASSVSYTETGFSLQSTNHGNISIASKAMCAYRHGSGEIID
jgi:hypothetical protein